MEAVMILVDLIHHPNSGLEQIAHRLKPKGIDIDVEAIRQLLAHYDLLKKRWILRHPMFESSFGEATKQPVAWHSVSRKTIDTVCARSEPLSTMPSSRPGIENPQARGRYALYRAFHRP